MSTGSRRGSASLTEVERAGYPAFHTGRHGASGLDLARVLATPHPGHFFSTPRPAGPERAAVFVDGNNWYHALRETGIRAIGTLDYRRISEKLVGRRRWVATRYYVGEIRQQSNPRLYAEQRRFLGQLRRTDARISVHLGRLESRVVESRAARDLQVYLTELPIRIDATVHRDLLALARKHLRAEVTVEKAVDVMLAVDLVVLAGEDRFDVAYLLSTDGDFTPAVAAVRSSGRQVFAASPGRGVMLQGACNAFIRLSREWFDDCRI